MINEAATTPLPSWESFYVIVGSSAGALTGLQFVVIALIAESRRRTTAAQIDAFGTPTIVHFCFVLGLSAILSAPWPTMTGPDFLLGASGLIGLAYVAIVTIRTRRQEGYTPVFEDWLWHVFLPFLSYAVLLIAALILRSYTTVALFLIGAIAIVLLFVGIHNAWDTVTFIVVTEKMKTTEKPAIPAAPSAADAQSVTDE